MSNTMLSINLAEIEKRMVDASFDNKDPYSKIASKVFDVPEKKVTRSQRRAVKSTAFFHLYYNKG